MPAAAVVKKMSSSHSDTAVVIVSEPLQPLQPMSPEINEGVMEYEPMSPAMDTPAIGNGGYTDSGITPEN